MPKIDIAAVPERKGSGYPPPFDAPSAERMRRRLGKPPCQPTEASNTLPVLRLTTLATPWETQLRWFDVQHASALRDLFSGFRKLSHAPILGSAVSSALYRYLRSNRGGEGAGVDGGIILSQAALERLVHAYLKTNSVSMPKSSHAADRLRTVLQRLSIPTDVPTSLSALHQLVSVLNDGPGAITKIRNELVHPEGRLPMKVGQLAIEAWNLSQWYIELIILRLAGYSGEYSNRLRRDRWVGQVEKVPWA